MCIGMTHDEKNNDCPIIIERKILNRYAEIYGKLPGWNNVF